METRGRDPPARVSTGGSTVPPPCRGGTAVIEGERLPPRPGDRELAAAVRDAPIGMMVIDRDGRVVQVNRAMCELVGRSEDELSDTAWRDLTHPDDHDVDAAEIAELSAGQRERFAAPKRYLRPDGEVRWALTCVSPVRDVSGDPITHHVVVTLPDLLRDDLGRQTIRATDAVGRDRSGGGTLEGVGSTDRAGVTGRILVVDDDPQVRTVFRKALAHAGHDVSEAGDAQTAHDLLAERTFDLALLDMGLSESSGAGIASFIRAQPRHAAMSIVFVSGDATLETKLAGLSAGGTDYLTKPVSLRELLGRVDAHLRSRLAWTDRLQSSLRERSQLASRVLELRGLADLPSIVDQLRDVLETSFPVDDLRFDVDRRATFAITGRAERSTIRLPLTNGAGPIGTLELTTSREHAQEAAAILSDLGPHIAVVSEGSLEADLDSRDARGWLEELAGTDGLTSVVQPVIALVDGTTVGYEALARFPGGLRPDHAIAAAWSRGIGTELETLAIERHLEAARPLPPDVWLALNISGQTLKTLPPELLGAAGREIVLELTEHESVDDYQLLRDRVAALPRTRLAIDDTGAGYASLRHIYELRPSLVKIDRTWINGCHADLVRQTLIRGLVALSAAIGADVVAEGIEHETELETLRTLGVPFGQGFLLGRPFEVSRAEGPRPDDPGHAPRTAS